MTPNNLHHHRCWQPRRNLHHTKGLTRTELDEYGKPGLLGLYEGVALTERDNGWSGALPDTIFIFRGPLSRLCETREELIEEIAITVIHEIAHHFGIDDERLHKLGWD